MSKEFNMVVSTDIRLAYCPTVSVQTIYFSYCSVNLTHMNIHVESHSGYMHMQYKAIFDGSMNNTIRCIFVISVIFYSK